MKARKDAYYYHSYDNHNNDEWWERSMYDGTLDHEDGFGGFTLFFDPVRKVVGISICSRSDRFNKKLGRKNAQLITKNASAHPGANWLVLCPTIATTSPWTALMLHCARGIALAFLAHDYPDASITFYTPSDRRKETIEERHAREKEEMMMREKVAYATVWPSA